MVAHAAYQWNEWRQTRQTAYELDKRAPGWRASSASGTVLVGQGSGARHPAWTRHSTLAGGTRHAVLDTDAVMRALGMQHAQRKALTALPLAGTFADVPSVHYVCVVDEKDTTGWATGTYPSGALPSGTYYAIDVWVVAFFGFEAYDDVRPVRARQLEEAKARRGAKFKKI